LDQLRGLLVKPNKLPEEITFDNSLEKKQELVEGYIEYAYSDDFPDVAFICNEEGKINGLPYNRDIGHDIIAGNFIIISSNVEDGEDVSLSDKQIEKYKKIFNDKSIEDTNIKITNIILQNNGFEI
jgi:hypothetical protein